MSEISLAKRTPWKSQKEGYQDAIYYLKGRKEGKIKSVRSPWPKFNDATVDGLEWNTINVIGGRPGSGKTLIKDQLIREAFILNPDENFRVLEFQLEMLARTSAIREYSSIIGASYKYLCSADGVLSDENLKKCVEYARAKLQNPVDIVETAPTVVEFEKIIDQYMETHHYMVDVPNEGGTTTSKKFYRKTIITLDHSVLIKKESKQAELQMLQVLGECLTKLKKKYPVIFIILSQLNRNIDNPERNEDGKYGNFVLESDIFGGDALLQHADTVIGLNRPGKQKIRFYGPDRYIIDNDRVLAMHFIKCRNGDNRISFFEAKFEQMALAEMPTPPTQEKRMSTK
jgi:replicative DNA helicase